MKILFLRHIFPALTTIIFFAANTSVSAACTGNWYQPITPAKLRHD